MDLGGVFGLEVAGVVELAVGHHHGRDRIDRRLHQHGAVGETSDPLGFRMGRTKNG